MYGEGLPGLILEQLGKIGITQVHLIRKPRHVNFLMQVVAHIVLRQKHGIVAVLGIGGAVRRLLFGLA